MLRWLNNVLALCLVAGLSLSPVGSVISLSQTQVTRVEQGPPLGGIMLRCPHFLQLYETDVTGLAVYYRPDLAGGTLVLWWLFRGLSLDDINQDLAHGTENKILYTDNDNLNPGDTYFYKLVITIAKDNQNTSIGVIYPDVLIPEYCFGDVYETLTLAGGDYPVAGLFIRQGGMLEIKDGATITPPPGSSTSIRCGYFGESGQLTITSSELFRPHFEINDGCTEFSMVGNRLHNLYLYLSGNLDKNTIAGNTFSYDTNLPEIDLANGAQLLMQANQGAFVLEMRDDAQATLTGNRISGSVYASEEARAWLEDNVITGTLSVDGYGAAAGNEAVTTAISTTLRCNPSLLSENFAKNKGTLNLAHSRLESPPGCNSVIEAYGTGSLVAIGDSWIEGKLNASAGGELVVYNSPSLQSDLYLSGQSGALLLNNSMFGNDIWVTNDATLNMNDNVVLNPWIGMDEQAKGVFRHNTLRGSLFGFAFDIYSNSDTPSLMIQENCIEVNNAVIIRNSRVNRTSQPLDLRKNWWQDASGPRHTELNHDGQGAYIADETEYGNPAPVDFSDYYQEPTFCYDSPPRLPQTASAIITPAGGALFAPDGSAQLQFPPGSVDQDTRVTYTEQDEDKNSAAFIQSDPLTLPPTGDALGVRFFDLTAVISDTGQPLVSFNLPYTLTINYSDGEISRTSESSLGLHYWNGAQWIRETSAVVYPAENRLVAFPDHMTIFAILGGVRSNAVYLPMLRSR